MMSDKDRKVAEKLKKRLLACDGDAHSAGAPLWLACPRYSD